MINQPNIMPLFVFARRRDIEIDAGFILAGQLVVDIPNGKTGTASADDH
jgi:hypothetical protein